MIITSEIVLFYVVHSYEYLLRLLMTLTVMHLACTLKCINKENMVLNLGEEPTTVIQYSRIYTYRYSLVSISVF